MMAATRLISLILIFTFYGVSQAQVYGRTVRTYVPSPPEPCYTCSNPDDLNSLLALARILESNDCSSSRDNQYKNNNDINTGAIIDKLINALVYTTTQNVGGGSGGNSGTSGSNDGLLISLLGALLGGGGSGSSGNSGSSSGKPRDQALIDLSLLDRNDLLKLGISEQDILRLGLGSDGSPTNSSGSTGVLGGVLNSVL